MAHIVFTLEDGSEVFADLNADIVTVGRHPESMVMLPSGSVSGQHATIKRRGDSYFVQDLGTTNGTRVNGVEVEEVKLEHGDLVAMGDVAGYFYVGDVVGSVGGSEEVESVEEVIVPVPDEAVSPAGDEPSLFLPEKYSSVPRGSIAQKPVGYLSGGQRSVKRYKESSGFGGFLVFLMFLVFAFLVGLHVRHGQEAGTLLIVDVIKKYRTKVESVPLTDEAEVPAPEGAEGAPAVDSAPKVPAPAAPEPAPAAPTPSPAPGDGDGMSGAAPSMGGEGMMGGGDGMMGGN